MAAGVGEVVVPGAEGGKVGGEEKGPGAVETAGRRVPGLFEDGEPLRPPCRQAATARASSDGVRPAAEASAA